MPIEMLPKQAKPEMPSMYKKLIQLKKKNPLQSHYDRQ